LYPSGQVGFIVASQGSCSVGGDATFDNFLATTAEPRLSVDLSNTSVTLTWLLIPFRLQSTPSLTAPVWTDITSGIVSFSDHNAYTSSTSGGARFFRLIYP